MSIQTRIKYTMVCNKCGRMLINNYCTDEFCDLGEVFEIAEISGWFVDGHDITYCDECRKTETPNNQI